MYDVDDDLDDSLDIVMVPDDDDDGPRPPTTTRLPPLPDRPQKGPNEFDTNPPPKVVQAFNVIMGIPKPRSAIRFAGSSRSCGACTTTSSRTSPTSRTRASQRSVMPGVARMCHPREETPLKALHVHQFDRLLGVSTLLLTTGTSGRDDLFFKFTDMLRGVRPDPSPFEYSEPSEEFCYRKKVEGRTRSRRS